MKNLNRKVHTMKLNIQDFEQIRDGIKTIESRVNDEKRQYSGLVTLLFFLSIQT